MHDAASSNEADTAEAPAIPLPPLPPQPPAPEDTPEVPAELDDVVENALDKISEDYAASADKSEDVLIEIVSNHLTDNEDVNEIIVCYARLRLLHLPGSSVA